MIASTTRHCSGPQQRQLIGARRARWRGWRGSTGDSRRPLATRAGSRGDPWLAPPRIPLPDSAAETLLNDYFRPREGIPPAGRGEPRSSCARSRRCAHGSTSRADRHGVTTRGRIPLGDIARHVVRVQHTTRCTRPSIACSASNSRVLGRDRDGHAARAPAHEEACSTRSSAATTSGWRRSTFAEPRLAGRASSRGRTARRHSAPGTPETAASHHVATSRGLSSIATNEGVRLRIRSTLT
jgi:hypothetical protein